MSWLRAVMMLALIVWIGGIIFFAFVLAPTLFTVLPPPTAGNVVAPSLSKLHLIGLAAGAVFLICSVVYHRLKYSQLKLFSATHLFVVLMLALTAVSQFGVTPRMRELRSQRLVADTGAARAEFDRLHNWSTRIESGVLLLGVAVVVLTARRWDDGSR
jgi:uncharacterized membrane protein